MKELALNVLDIAQNSVKAGAAHILVSVVDEGNVRTLVIEDDGCGMTPAFLAQVTDPFTTTRTTRKVGLGLPLLKLAAEQTGGRLEIASATPEMRPDAHGTRLTATFFTDHVDCEPLGDMADTFAALVQGSPALSFHFRLRAEGRDADISTDEMREMLGDEVPLSDPAVLSWLRDAVNEPA